MTAIEIPERHGRRGLHVTELELEEWAERIRHHTTLAD
jgi:hypothetical protein